MRVANVSASNLEKYSEHKAAASLSRSAHFHDAANAHKAAATNIVNSSPTDNNASRMKASTNNGARSLMKVKAARKKNAN